MSAVQWYILVFQHRVCVGVKVDTAALFVTADTHAAELQWWCCMLTQTPGVGRVPHHARTLDQPIIGCLMHTNFLYWLESWHLNLASITIVRYPLEQYMVNSYSHSNWVRQNEVQLQQCVWSLCKKVSTNIIVSGCYLVNGQYLSLNHSSVGVPTGTTWNICKILFVRYIWIFRMNGLVTHPFQNILESLDCGDGVLIGIQLFCSLDLTICL